MIFELYVASNVKDPTPKTGRRWRRRTTIRRHRRSWPSAPRSRPVRAADACEQSPAVLRVDGSVIGTMGNFSASIGKAKSKKTFNVAALTAAALANGTVLHYRASFPEEKRGILYIDTEQGRPQGAELTTARCRSTRHRECLCGCFREICRGASEKVRVGSF